MNTLKIISISVLLLGLGLSFICLGVIAFKSPQKIVDYQFKRYRLLKYYEKVSFLKSMYDDQVVKANNGYYAANWRRASWALILWGLIVLFALISYLIK